MLVHAAGKRGLPYAIFRPGTISGDTQTGASNAEAYVNKLFASLLCLRAYPDVNEVRLCTFCVRLYVYAVRVAVFA